MQASQVGAWLRVAFAGAIALALIACGDDTAATESEGDSADDPSDPDDGPPTPKFIDPSSQKLTLFTHEHADVELRVEDIIPGNTHVAIDGHTVGAPGEDNPIATLTPDMLYLHLQGAMVTGTHTLELVTTNKGEEIRSVTIELEIVRAASAITLNAEETALDIAPGLTTRALHTAGTGQRGLLLLLTEDDATPTLRVLRAWEPSAPLDVPLDGYVHSDISIGPAFTAALLGETVRVAWRVGLPGAAIAGLDTPWGAAPDPGQTRELASTPPPLLHAAEWTAYGRPTLLHDLLIAELYAPADVETPHPGDHQLIKVAWTDDVLGEPGPAQPVALGSRFDLETPGPVIDASAVISWPPPAAAVRSSGVRPALLRRASAGTLLYTVGHAEARTGVSADLPASTATVLGAFASQTTATAASSLEQPSQPAIALSFQNGSSRYEDPNDVSWTQEALAADPPSRDDRLPLGLAPSAALAPALLAGTPVFLVPYADEASVHALISTGNAVLVQRLGDLQCDAIATPADLAGNLLGEQLFACLQDGIVNLGALRLTRS